MRVSNFSRGNNFSLLQIAQTDCGAQYAGLWVPSRGKAAKE